VLDGVAAFADLHLGKGVVVAKDSPNFIGNHLALFDVVRAGARGGGHLLDRRDRRDDRRRWPAEERHLPDARSRRHRHRPHVVRQFSRAAADPAARATFVLPPFVEQMLAAGGR
jgi:3-hydroxyacyl-CoA dehydrogenase